MSSYRDYRDDLSGRGSDRWLPPIGTHTLRSRCVPSGGGHAYRGIGGRSGFVPIGLAIRGSEIEA